MGSYSAASTRAIHAFRAAYHREVTQALPGDRIEFVISEALKEGVESALRVYFEQIEQTGADRERAFYMFGYHPD